MIEHNIKKLIKILEESNIDEIEVSTFWGKQNIRIKKSPSTDDLSSQYTSKQDKKIEASSPPIGSSATRSHAGMEKENMSNEKSSAESVLSEDAITIKAPLVGTFYISPKPGADPFIGVGESISKGQIICIVEAMKIFNEIESEYDGKVIEILVKDGAPIEFDQPLMLISPD